MPAVGEVIEGSFGHFELLKPLGSGGMAEVFLAANLDEHGQQYALKFVREELLDDEELIERFINEAKNLRNLAHPNIVRFYDFYALLPEYAYIVMDYIEGISLQHLLRSYGPRGKRIPPLTFSLPLLARIGMALTRIHNTNTIHRDVKTANILVREKDCEVFLGDLGIARNLQHSQFMTEGLVGTIAYMAPEQHLSRPLSPATDVYALGTIAYELFAGRRPFLGDLDTRSNPSRVSITRNEAIMEQRLTMPPPAISEFNPELPEALNEVFYKVLSVEAEKRYARANEFIEALHKALLSQLPDNLQNTHALGQVLPYPTAPAFLPEEERQMNVEQQMVKRVVLPKQNNAPAKDTESYGITSPTALPPHTATKGHSRGLLIAAVLLVVGLLGGVIAWQTGILPTPTPQEAAALAANPTEKPAVEPTSEPTMEEAPPPTMRPAATPSERATIMEERILHPAATPQPPTLTSTPRPSATPPPPASDSKSRFITMPQSSTLTSASLPSATPPPTLTSASLPSATPPPTLTSTSLPSATPPPTLTSTSLPSATPPPTLTSTSLPSATPRPTLTRDGALSNLETVVMGGPIAFNCVVFNETYTTLRELDYVPDIPEELSSLYAMVDSPTDPIRRIYDEHCQQHAAATTTSLPGGLQNAFVQLVFDLESQKNIP